MPVSYRGTYGYNNFTGIVYVYEKTGATWSSNPTATLEASDAAEGNFFCIPAIDNDVIVIGAPYNGAGVAYIFEKSGATWLSMTETAKITASDAVVGDYFADYIAIEGNILHILSNNSSTMSPEIVLTLSAAL